MSSRRKESIKVICGAIFSLIVYSLILYFVINIFTLAEKGEKCQCNDVDVKEK